MPTLVHPRVDSRDAANMNPLHHIPTVQAQKTQPLWNYAHTAPLDSMTLVIRSVETEESDAREWGEEMRERWDSRRSSVRHRITLIALAK